VIKIEGNGSIKQHQMHEYAKHVLQDEKILFEEIILDDGKEQRELDEENVLYEYAKKLLSELGRISFSMLQKNLQIGYTKTDKLINRLEENGIIEVDKQYGNGMKKMTVDARESLERDGDFLFCEAKSLVVKTGKCSTSMIQRRLKIGYSRAAMIVDFLEEKGIVSPPDELYRREVLK